MAKPKTQAPPPRDYTTDPLKAGELCSLRAGGPVMVVERTRPNPDIESEQLGDLIYFDEKSVEPVRCSIPLACLAEH